MMQTASGLRASGSCHAAARSRAAAAAARAASRPRPSLRRSRTATARAAAAGAPAAGAAAAGEASTSGRAAEAAYVSLDDDCEHEVEFIDWRWGSKLRYVRAGRRGPPLLLVHGFGVGSYHFERNIPALARSHRVYAIDLLGQGQSWPERPECEASGGRLRLSADTWTEQLHHFITDHVGEPCYVAGNSLGGFLACNLAARHPDAVRGVVLLNAAPFWGSRPPGGGGGSFLWRLLPLDASVPVSPRLKALVQRTWWGQITQPSTVRSLLSMVYARPERVDDATLRRILDSAAHPAALDAFASILLSPKTELTFDEMLERLTCPVLLAYGQDDPWVVPFWGQRAMRVLQAARAAAAEEEEGAAAGAAGAAAGAVAAAGAAAGAPATTTTSTTTAAGGDGGGALRVGRRSATYLELSPAGHCPHHEVPATVNSLIEMWVAAVEAGAEEGGAPVLVGAGGREELMLRPGARFEFTEADGAVVTVRCLDGAPRTQRERWDEAKWRLARAWRRALRQVSGGRLGGGGGGGAGSAASSPMSSLQE